MQKYLKRTEKASRHESDVKIVSSYGEAKIRAEQQEAGGRGAAVLFLVTCLCIPVHNYLKLKEEGERHRKEAEKDFPVIVVVDCNGNNLYETAIKEYAREEF